MSLKILILSVTILAFLAYVGVSVYIASVLTTPGATPLEFDKNQIGQRVSDVTFRATDGIQLVGWLYQGTNEKAIMFVHGAGDQNRVNKIYGTPEIAKHFVDLGYTVLLFDLRGFGESQKTRMSFGQNEANDVTGAFNYLVEQEYEPSEIGIISNSMGAITAIMAAESVNRAGAIVLDSPATHIKDITSNIMREENNVPDFLHPGIFLMAKLFYGVDIDKVRPIDRVMTLSDTPLLFLHGEEDTLIPPSHSEELFNKVSQNAQRVTFPNTGHVETYVDNKEEYVELVSAFFEQNLVGLSP